MYRYFSIFTLSTFAILLGNYLRKRRLFNQVWKPLFKTNINNSIEESLEKIYESSNVYLNKDKYGGMGVFAKQDIQKGEIVEKGIVRVLKNCDGNENPHVFTWSDEIPNHIWAIGSGCSTFYNTGNKEEVNTHMVRDYINNTFFFIATKNIKKDEELLHLYKSKGWRTCFSDLNDEVKNKDSFDLEIDNKYNEEKSGSNNTSNSSPPKSPWGLTGINRIRSGKERNDSNDSSNESFDKLN